MNDERGDATNEIEMTEAERERRDTVVGEVDGVKEKSGYRDKVKHTKNSDQLFIEKMM